MANFSGFEIIAFDCRLRVVTSCQEAHDVLNRYLFPSFPRLVESDATPDLHIGIEQDGSGSYRLRLNEVRVATAPRPVELVPGLIHQVDELILKKLNRFRAVHAGAVQITDRALLLPGRTHSGKSSMIAELIRRGATYMSDEYALIDAEGRAHAYPRPLLLRNGTSTQSPLLPGECHAPVATQPVPVGWIMELQYQENGTWEVASVPQSHGLLILMRHTPHILAEAPDLLQKFEKAASLARCYTGRRMDVARAADKIFRLVSMES